MASPESATIEVAAYTHRGRVRRRNEDCIAVGAWLTGETMEAPRLDRVSLDAPLVCLVLDGMGGHANGQLAARLAAEHLAEHLPGCRTELQVRDCIRAANRRLYDRMEQDPQSFGMGTTLAGLRLAREGVALFNVGDSRVYRVQDGFLSQLSTDDVPPPYPRPGRIAVRTGVITQSLGGAPLYTDIDPHIVTQPMAAPRTYLLCSDGLYDRLPIDAMEAALGEDLGESVMRLFELAMSAGAPDNVSIILARAAP
jgi:serine/threonine protein phosphatase PrpC